MLVAASGSVQPNLANSSAISFPITPACAGTLCRYTCIYAPLSPFCRNELAFNSIVRRVRQCLWFAMTFGMWRVLSNSCRLAKLSVYMCLSVSPGNAGISTAFTIPAISACRTVNVSVSVQSVCSCFVAQYFVCTLPPQFSVPPLHPLP